MTPRRIDDEYTFSYIVQREAWYHTGPHSVRDLPAVSIMASADGGGVKWEFDVEEHDICGGSLRLRVFADAFDAFTDVPGFFAGMAANPPKTLTALVFLLDHMGAQDITERTRRAA